MKANPTPTASDIAAETLALFPTPDGREGLAEALTEFGQLKVGEQLGYVAWLQAQTVRQLGALDGRIEVLTVLLGQADARRTKAGEEAVAGLRRELRKVREAVEDAGDEDDGEAAEEPTGRTTTPPEPVVTLTPPASAGPSANAASSADRPPRRVHRKKPAPAANDAAPPAPASPEAKAAA